MFPLGVTTPGSGVSLACADPTAQSERRTAGVAKEIKRDEYRVALTPAGARELVLHGHDVLVETGAGEGSAFADQAYEAVGARVASVDDVWAEAELLLKVKEPIAAKYQ